MSDENIVRGFLSGNKAEHSLVTEWILEVCHAKLWIDDHSRDDIISETSMKLLLNLRSNRFLFESSFKTYVQRITRYTIVDYVRASRRAREYHLEYLQRASHDPDPHDLLETEEQTLIFNTIVAMMNEECRKIWKMIFFEQRTYKAIAQALSITEGTVKIKVFRCKETAILLRKKLW